MQTRAPWVMTKQEQNAEPVDEEAEPTAELEMLPASALDPTDSHQILDARYGDENFVDADADRAAAGAAAEDSCLGDTLETLRIEIDSVRALTETLDRDVQDSQGVTSVLAKDLEAMRMKQAATEELLGLCRSEIEKLKSQMMTSEHEPAMTCENPGAGGDPALQVPPPVVPDHEQQSEFAALPVVDTDDSSAVANAASVNKAQVLPITAIDDAPGAQTPERLLVVRNCSTTKSYPLEAGNVRLGSSPDNDIRLGSSYVSRHHAEFVSSGAGCVLKDLDSTNGTYVNSRRVRRCALRNGDWIAIGKHRFEFVEHQ